MGTLTFSSLARLSDYRSPLTSTANQGRSKATPIPTVSSQIPTGKVDARTEQALQWSGLKAGSSQNESAPSSLFSSPDAFSHQSAAPSLDFAYSFASIKGILAYRDALLARSPEPTDSAADQA